MQGTTPHSKRRLLTLTTGAITLLVLAFHLTVYEYQRLELQTRDGLVRMGRRAELDPSIVMLAIDQPSTTLDELFSSEIEASPTLRAIQANGFPFPRSVYADAMERLFAAGAKVVAVDLMFPAPRDGDEIFRATLERHRDKVVIASNFSDAKDPNSTAPLTPPSASLIPPDTYDDRVGFVNFKPDEDAIVRRAIYRTTLREFSDMPAMEGEPPLFALSARMAQKGGYAERVPQSTAAYLFRPAAQGEPISLYKIFVDQLWKSKPFDNGAFFKDKIVLIGPYGAWSKDYLNTPLQMVAGPRVHLSALNALVRGELLWEPPRWAEALLVLAGGGVALALGLLIAGPVRRTLALLGAGVGYFGAALLLYNTAGVLLILLSPLLALALSGGTWLGVERLLEIRERLRVRSFLERYVSKDVVREVLDNPESFLHTLGGMRKNITVLFSDVRGFTTITESGDAPALVKQLNEYFTEMVRIVFKHEGTLDKFIGDAVMATWGGIKSSGEGPDTRNGVEAALEMLRVLKRLNADWKARGMLELKVGIGVNHGAAVCGHLGSEEKQEFSVIGDAVNLASRLEGATKEFHVDLLIGESTAELVRDSLTLRTVDLLQLKGKTKPTEVFTVLDEPTPPEWLQHYEQGVRLYRQRQFTEGEQAFAQAAALAPEDWLIAQYQERCRQYAAEPPDAAWNGVYVMKSK